MRKVWTMGVVAGVAAASLGVAAPASAQTCTPSQPLPTTSPVTIENGQIRIDPSTPEVDPNDLVDDAYDVAMDGVACGWAAVPAPVRCAYDAGYWGVWYGYYVYTDPYTGEIVIDYGELQGDVNDCI